MTGVPFASTRWDQIIPNLFQGGYDWIDDGCFRWAVVADEFDVVLSLYDRNSGGPDEGVEHHRARISDNWPNAGWLMPYELEIVRGFADIAEAGVRAGRRVLSRCHAGYNRSGLLTAFTLLRLGYSSQDAIDLIREKRSEHALCNEYFVGYIFAEGARLARLTETAVA